MRNFDTGAVRDSDDRKLHYTEALSGLAIKRFARYMKKSEKKYGKGNWKKGIPRQAYFESLSRHFFAFWLQFEYGKKDKYDHLSGILFNTMGLMHEEEKDGKSNTNTNGQCLECSNPDFGWGDY